MEQIAQNYNLTLADLLRLNGLDNPDMIWVGQKLRVTARVAVVPAPQPDKLEPAEAIYVVKAGDTLADIAKANNTTVEDLMVANGLPNINFVWTGQRLRVKAPDAATLSTMGVAGAPADGKRWIEVDLSKQTLTAWQGDVAVMHTTVSTGKASTPTVVGTFHILTKYDSQEMTGDGYDLPGVPWVMYFYQGYAIHGAYWHMSFGTPLSHGCVNMHISDAQALYQWAAVGTEVDVHS